MSQAGEAMIVGIGLDVCCMVRIRKALERYGDRFFNRICTEQERRDLLTDPPVAALAGRFAAKEAFAKALGGADGIGWHDVQVRRASGGKPYLFLGPLARSRVQERGVTRWHVTITHDAQIAAAVVILEV